MARVQCTVPDMLKEKVSDKISNSNLTYSDLMKGAMQNFLDQYEDLELECECDAVFTIQCLEAAGGKCPKCGKEVTI